MSDEKKLRDPDREDSNWPPQVSLAVRVLELPAGYNGGVEARETRGKARDVLCAYLDSFNASEEKQ